MEVKESIKVSSIVEQVGSGNCFECVANCDSQCD